MEQLKRSSRTRKASAKVRVFEQHMRDEIKRKRLASLEQDNWHEERRTVDEDEDEDYVPLDDDESGDGEHAARFASCQLAARHSAFKSRPLPPAATDVTVDSKRSSSKPSRENVCSQRRRCSAYIECTSGVK